MLTQIMGKSILTAEMLDSYIKSINPNAPLLGKIYIEEGELEGVRGDLLFCQSVVETGNYTFKGSAVTLDQNNFAGLGVTKTGKKGNSYETPRLGVRAQCQHMKAYASTEPLKNVCIDERFKYVQRGCAPYVEWLGQKENPNGKGWATGPNYGQKILNVYNKIASRNSIVSNIQQVNTPKKEMNAILVKQAQNWLRFFASPATKIDGIIKEDDKKALVKAVKIYGNNVLRVKMNPSTELSKEDREMFKKFVVRSGSTGPHVMIFKIALLFNGYEPNDLTSNVDKDLVNMIFKVQSDKNLKQDGIAGYNTWNSLI